MMMLAAQLRWIAGSPGEAPRDPDAARAEIEALLAAPGEAPRLVVLDGLDEAVGWSVPRDLQLPAEASLPADHLRGGVDFSSKCMKSWL